MTTDEHDEQTARIDLDGDHEMTVEYAGTFGQLLGTDELLYVGQFEDVDWRPVLADGERAVVFSVTVSPMGEPETPPTATDFKLGDESPLRETTAAEWLGDPSVEPVPDHDSVYWMCDAPLHHGKGGAIAFAVGSDERSAELRYGDAANALMEVRL